MKENLKRKGLMFALLWAMSLGALFAQNITVRGTVVDDFGDPLSGAVVVVQENRAIGTATNLDGEFTLNDVPPHGHLIVSFMGFNEQTVAINGRTEINIVLQEGVALDEVVVGGFRRQRRESVVGAVTTIEPGQLRTTSSTLSHGFAGQLAGVVSVQRSGAPGADGASFWIRGISSFAGATQPLIFIDGIEATIAAMNALPPEVIESFSVLKDATATALYGARGANGVILIVTRTGERNERATVNVRVETAMTQPTRMVQFADGPTYMTLFNEALTTRGGPARFPQYHIDATRAGVNPYIFPNVNWKDFLFRDWAYNQTANINVRGGADRVTYFMNVMFVNETGKFRNDPNNRFDNNLGVQRFTMQGNIVSDLTPTTQAALRLNSIITNRSGSATSVGSLYSSLFVAPGVFFPPFFPAEPGDTHIRFGNRLGGPIPNMWGSGQNLFHNPYAAMVSGYERFNQALNTVAFELSQDLAFVTEGLRARGLISFRNLATGSTVRAFTPQFYMVRDYQPDLINFYLGDPITIGEQALGFGSFTHPGYNNRDVNINLFLDYNRTFGGVHEVGGLLTYMQREWNRTVPGSFMQALPTRSQGMAFRATYAFDRRYMLEMNIGYSGSENFPPGGRFGIFPSFAIGYNISQEEFWAPMERVIPSLRFRASWGRVGNADIGGVRFPYRTEVAMGGRGYMFGDQWAPHGWRSGAVVTRYGAVGARWEIATMRNVGLSMNLFNAFDLSVDVYDNMRSGIFMQHRTIAVESGVTGDMRPFSNIGKVRNRGVDVEASFNRRFANGLLIGARGTFTYAANELIDRDEPISTPPWLSEIGRPLHTFRGLRSMGLFRDWDEIANSPTQDFGSVMPGDIRFMSLAGNDFIDAGDETWLGHPRYPQILFGAGFSAEFRNFDFSAFFQGVGRVSLMMGGIHPFSVHYSQLFQFIADDHWSEVNPNPNARYPRLISGAGGQNNHRVSDFWLRDASYVRLRDMEVGYTHRNIRFYVSGRNLITWSPFTYWEPELGSGNGMGYPPLRVVAAGLQLTF